MVSLIIPNIKLKNVFLVLASLLFYAYGEAFNVVLMLAVILFSYLIALFCRQKKSILALGVVGNLSLLCVYKYADFLVSTFNAITGLYVSQPNIALPIGISFFIFQAISYLIDVYRDDVKASKSLINVTLYISFFPQLVAGPIIRYHDVEEQIKNRHATIMDIAKGLRRFSVGLAKKVLIADVLAVSVDAIYAADSTYIGISVAWIAATFYMLQIYFDFSGYSDMAIGMAHMFGFKYQENFRHPYISTSLKEFWRRWHISLSTWFKEYLYIPLGGNRSGRGRCVCNKVLVFFVCGLWHGAAWTFVVWGLCHGLLLLLEEYLPMKRINKQVWRIFILLFVCLTFVIFRSENFGQATIFLTQMFNFFQTTAQLNFAIEQLEPLHIFTFIVGCVAATPILEKIKKMDRPIFSKASYPVSLTLLILSMLTLAGSAYSPFIYFRF